MPILSAAEVAEALGGKRSGLGWMARCPAHDDKHPSLSINDGNGKVLVHCFAGCPQESVISILRDRGLWSPENSTVRVNRVTTQAHEHALVVNAVADADRESGRHADWSDRDRSDVEDAGRLLNIPISLADVTARHVQWLWRYRIVSGALTIWSGDPGVSKSLLTAAIATHISLGTDFPCNTGTAPLGDVLFLQVEDDLGFTLKPRLMASGADLTRIHALTMKRVVGEDGKCRDEMYSLKSDLPEIAASIKYIPDLRLLVVDPVNTYIGSNTDIHRDNEVRGVLTPLNELARELGIAILGIMHNRKARTTNAVHAPLGSVAYTGVARVLCAVGVDPEDDGRRIIVPSFSNLGPADNMGLAYRIETVPVEIGGVEKDYPVLVWETETVDITAAELLAPRLDHRRDSRDEAKEWLRDELRNGTVRVSVLEQNAETDGIAWRTLKRAKGELGVKSVKERFGGEWKWGFPEQIDRMKGANRRTSGQVGPLRGNQADSG